MKKIDREKFHEEIQQIIINYGDDGDLAKIEFVKSFIKKLLKVDDLEDIYIGLGCISSKTLLYLFVSLLMVYENTNQNPKEKYLKYDRFKESPPYLRRWLEEETGKIKRLEKDICCVEVKVDDIFPIGDFAREEVKFIENILDKMQIDVEYEMDILLSTKQLIHLITGIIREYDDFKGEIPKNNSIDQLPEKEEKS